jgi:hypothetical protein
MSATLLLAAVVIVVVVTVWAVIGGIGDLGNLGGNGSGGLSWECHSGGTIVHVSMHSNGMPNAQTYLKPRRPTMRSLIGLNILNG